MRIAPRFYYFLRLKSNNQVQDKACQHRKYRYRRNRKPHMVFHERNEA